MMTIERQIERLAADIEHTDDPLAVDNGGIDERLLEGVERRVRPTAVAILEQLDGRLASEGEDPIDLALERVLERLVTGGPRRAAAAAAPALAAA